MPEDREYNVWDCHLNRNTYNWGGAEWVVDGERGRNTYPGDWTMAEAKEAYARGE